MGVTSSKQKVGTFQDNLTQLLNESTQSIANTTNASIGTSQNMTLKGFAACGGDINIGEIGQTFAGQFNFSQMSTTTATADFQAAMKNAIESMVKKDTTIKNELGGVGATNDEQFNEQVNKNISKMVNAVNQETLSAITTNMNSSQSLEIIDFSTVCGPGLFGIGGDINIGKIDQTIQLDLVTAQVASLATSVYQDIVQANEAAIEAGSTLYLENSGFASLISAWFSGITGIIVTVVIVLALLIAVIVIPVIVLRRRKRKQAQSAATVVTPTEAPASSPTQAPVAPEASPSIQAQAKEFAKYAPPTQTPMPKTNLSPSKFAGYAQQGISSAQKLLKSDTVKKGLSGLSSLTKGLF